MDKEYLKETQKWVKKELESSVNFWLKYGMDKEHGGIYTCIDRFGKIYSTDKSVWMQGRCAWTYSYLCNMYGKKDEWMKAAKSCLDFMEEHCINRKYGNRMYFQVTADGKPLRQRRYCFSEGFYCIANAEYYGVTQEEIYLERALEAYNLIYNLNNGLIKDPTGLGPKVEPDTRTGRALGDPMIFLNITSVMRRVDPENADLYDKHAKECVDKIFKYHMKKDLECTLENVGMNGEVWKDVTVGRFVNPGHDIECSWFLAEYANYVGGDKGKEIYDNAMTVFNWATKKGWDNEYEGLLYFTDCLGNPPEAYEHDMKLWWPHNELLIASLMFYRDTKDEKYLDWFKKGVDYCKKYFCDPEYGEWYGYLRRDGKPTMPSTKGSTFKGPFHVPRSLIMVDKMIDELLSE